MNFWIFAFVVVLFVFHPPINSEKIAEVLVYIFSISADKMCFALIQPSWLSLGIRASSVARGS